MVNTIQSTIMKNNITTFLLTGSLFLVTVACSEDDQMSMPQSEKVWMEFSAGTEAATRTILTEGNKVNWETNDVISLFDPQSNNNRFTTSESGSSVTFTGTAISDEGNYYALYPYDESATISGSIITTTLPAQQTARAGSFTSMLNPSVAVADENKNLHFKNTCALIKFTLDSGNNSISRITFRGNNGEPLAGTVSIDATQSAPSANIQTESAATTLEMTGTFESGATYYFVTAPGTLSNGITIRIYNKYGNVWTRSGSTSMTLTAGHIMNLGNIAPNTFSPESGYEFVDGIYHIYNAEGLISWAQQTDKLTSKVILEADIDMTDQSWTPVGTDINTGTGFSGEFNGNGKYINNLTIENEYSNIGFFGGLATGAKVHNVNFSKATITGGSSSYAGVIAGASLGIINNCKVTDSNISGNFAGAITGNNSVQVNNCNAINVNVNAIYSAGGIAGVSYGKIEYCTVSGRSSISTTGTNTCAGGIVGQTTEESGIPTSGRLFKCAVDNITISALRAGGIAGENSFGIIGQCIVNQIKVTYTSYNSNTCLGGVVGYNTRGSVVASYSAYSTIGTDNLSVESLGGIVGYNNSSSAYVYGCYSTHVSLLGIANNNYKGAIAGYTNGHITSCYAILPDDVSGIKLVGNKTDYINHCVEIGQENYLTLITNVEDLKDDSGTIWKATNIWDLTASGIPSIQSDYTGETNTAE